MMKTYTYFLLSLVLLLGLNPLLISQPTTSEHINGVYFTSQTDGFVFGTNSLFQMTDDAGVNWTPLSSPVPTEWRFFARADASTVFVSTTTGYILRSTNNGFSFVSAFTGNANNSINQLSFANSLTGFATGMNGLMLKTTSGGLNWLPLTSPSTLNQYLCEFTSPTNGWVGGTGSLFKTTTGGTSWTTAITEAPTVVFHDMFWQDASKGWVVGFQGKVYKTTDGGQTWNQVTVPVTADLFKITFSTPTHGFISGKSGTFLMTTNGGSTWTQIPNIPGKWIFDVTFTTPRFGFACGESGTFLFTGDSGYTWTPTPPVVAIQRITHPDARFLMYPNPSTGNVFVYLNDLPGSSLQVSVYDLQGRKVRETKTDKQTTFLSIQLNVEGLKPGIYSVILSNENEFTAIEKLILQ